jgi:hypothetical protein
VRPVLHCVLDRRSGPKGNGFKTVLLRPSVDPGFRPGLDYDAPSGLAGNVLFRVIIFAPLDGAIFMSPRFYRGEWFRMERSFGAALTPNNNNCEVEVIHIPKISFSLSPNSALLTRLNSPIAYNIRLESMVLRMLGRM